ncbi:pantetheine-phosphate adenylyltransferase [Candidatus Jorgensenbacteria bacterium]|nr:pantetheine-phosphate adenylyltransferase [Candidatus Jorgensenbacteria bacterium]
MKQRIAVYAGTFDVLTAGHLWMIEEGSRLFDRLIVAIGVNPEKEERSWFTLEERLLMLKESVKNFSSVSVTSFTNQYLITYAKSVGAEFMLRGIRTVSDYEYERTMRNINEDLGNSVTTIFLMPPRELAEVSSSIVKSLIGPEGWERVVEDLVPDPVFEKLKRRLYAR